MTHAERGQGLIPTDGHASWRFRAAWVAIGVVALAVWLAVSRTSGEPDWWTASRSTDARVVHNADEVEGAVLAQMTLVRADESPWTVSMTERDACDWLSVRLPIWLRSRGVVLPDGVGAVRVSFAPEGIYAGAKMDQGGAGGRVVWVLLEPRVDDRGLWLHATRAGLGTTGVPVGGVLDGSLLPERVRAAHGVSDLLAVLRADSPALADPSARVDSSRRVQLTGVQPEQGRLRLTAKTTGR